MQIRSRFFFIIILLGALLNPASSQAPYSLKYSTDNGLSSNIIYDIIQDRDSYLWIATDKGVCRYDGYGFKIYNLKDGLADNEVIKIKQDKLGRIWFLTLIGKLSFFYQDSFYNKSNCSYLAQIPDAKGYLNSFAEDASNCYFGSVSGELFRLGIDSSFEIISSNNDGFNTLWETEDGVFSSHSNKLYQRELSSWKILDKKNYPIEATSSRTRIYSFNKLLFLCAGDRLWSYDIAKDELLLDVTFSEPNTDITSFFFDSKKKLWVGTRKGVYLAQSIEEAKAGNWTLFMENSLITCIYEDSEKNTWIGTMGKALHYIPHSDILWIHKPYQEASNQITTCLFVNDNNELWSGHDNSSFTIHTSKGEITNSLGNPSNLERISKIRAIDNKVWVIGKSRIRIISRGDTVNIPYFGNDMILDQQGNYWLASNYIYKIPKSHIDSVILHKRQANASSVDKIAIRKRGNTLYEDPKGGIWIGLFEGLYYFKSEKLIALSEIFPKLRGKINDIKSSPDGRSILVATDNFGVVEIDITSKKIKTNSLYNRLGNIRCSSITFKGKKLWLGTNSGIIFIDLNSDWNPIYYSDLLGLKNLHVLDIVINKKRLYAASSNGLLEFNNIDPENIFKDAPRIFLTGAYLKDNNLSLDKNVILEHSENELILKFKGISFKERGSLSYKYLVKGLDKSFQYSNNREVILKAIPSGKYEIIIYAINKAGIESNVPAVFKFQVKNPYWQTWWFALIILFSIALLFFLALRIRLSFVRKEYELQTARLDEEKKLLKLENELSEVEQHALRLQMNPHFIFNALNSIKGYYAEKRVAEADEYLSRFSKILRHILENSRRYSSIEEEIDILHLYLEMAQMRHPGMFDYKIELQEGLNISDYSLPALLLQPFVENAIMHGIAPKAGRGHILVACYLEQENLICTIKDNGIGYSVSQLKKREKEHQSKAIEISKKRLEYITRQEGVKCSVDINDVIENGIIIGTEVRISIPAKKLW